jgi:ASC-1-like (ASCH) protein
MSYIVCSSEDKRIYTEYVSEPWFTLILLGIKTIDGRKNSGRFKDIKIGDIIKWENNDFMYRIVLTRVERISKYKTFKEYLEQDGLEQSLPGISDIEYGLSVYYKYFTKEDEEKFGVVAIKIKIVKKI